MANKREPFVMDTLLARMDAVYSEKYKKQNLKHHIRSSPYAKQAPLRTGF